jgi:hypothetical protein
LLLNGIEDKRFLGPVTSYGIDLVESTFRQPVVKKASQSMIYDVLVKEQKVVNEAINFCSWFV